MESIEIGLKLFVIIIVISLFFALVGFLAKIYLSNFFDKIFSLIKNIFKKRTDYIVVRTRLGAPERVRNQFQSVPIALGKGSFNN